ncbi:prevent-host-death family protein [Actinopolymorpha cephalotaxi]|uniref:Antitoxin n=1 Tax=Actinopolymorpha cephalotaxi TaxID=504797 RepID=A0A1I3BDT7_9ACTN|nr:type II toxin-antitoxin system prevent-host-death family antitoxin [Actinopolymorpha cephalotaxi]NYH86754.1 prevent-host-death family protein [Actinopolymorpha cephalotaxi]SFH60099.1 prevent-host-death family protein [Actinopolymorpha cephalotaxi]
MSHGLPEPTPDASAEVVTITDARTRFGSLVRRAAHTRQRVIITDHGQAAAAIISAAELEDLEDRLAITQYQLEKANGTLRTVPHEQAKRRLGLSE